MLTQCCVHVWVCVDGRPGQLQVAVGAMALVFSVVQMACPTVAAFVAEIWEEAMWAVGALGVPQLMYIVSIATRPW